jgi:hypothetical protein
MGMAHWCGPAPALTHWRTVRPHRAGARSLARSRLLVMAHWRTAPPRH